MHMSEAGFAQLIRGQCADWRVAEFDESEWPVLWDQFLFSARRWGERELLDILGENLRGEPIAQIRDPFLNYDNLDDSDRKLIGEFIRRHHSRMSHEFAVYGIPGMEVMSLDGVLSPQLRDIAGMVARSHGLPARACLDYLQQRYHRREFAGVHAIYLIALVRVADCLQIQAERAPAIVLKYRHIPSRLSRQEWKAHQAITNITRTHDDPESLEIQAQPIDVLTYLRLKEWLAVIQHELDASWAVLGETYGSHSELCDLGLILRRVRSNLDDTRQFAAEVNYVPAQIELAVARPDLLRLLVGPLYENIPSIGIRELLQNAIDAVRERWALQAKHPELQSAPLLAQDGDVEIWLDDPNSDGTSWLTVSDRGIGMTVDVIRDYFLTAGASFRNSDVWRREFEVDGPLHSRVLRSGRFGVGVLAGFLLGARLDVATRHIRERSGVRFSTAMELRPIELRHDSSLPVGTTIRVLVPEAVRAHLLANTARVAVPSKWDWFVYDAPSVVRRLGTDKRVLARQFEVARPSPEVASEFRRLQSSARYDLYWTFRDLPRLSVNGIFVNDSDSKSTLGMSFDYAKPKGQLSIEIKVPNLCVEDPDAVFPINLRRSAVIGGATEFRGQLLQDVIDDFLAYLLVNCPETDSPSKLLAIRQHPGVRVALARYGIFTSIVGPFGASAHGLTLLTPTLVRSSGARSLRCFFAAKSGATQFPPHRPDCLYAPAHAEHSRYSSDPWPKEVFSAELLHLAALELAQVNRPHTENPLLGSTVVLSAAMGPSFSNDGVRLLLAARIARLIASPKELVARAVSQLRKPNEARAASLRTMILGLCEGLAVEELPGPHAIVTTGVIRKTLQPLELTDGGESDCVLELLISPLQFANAETSTDEVSKRWLEVFGGPFVPFNPSARQLTLRRAYDILSPFVRVHEDMRRRRVLF